MTSDLCYSQVKENIRKAIERYEISHPVINDSELDVWNEFSVKCWPTLILISPGGKVCKPTLFKCLCIYFLAIDMHYYTKVNFHQYQIMALN